METKKPTIEIFRRKDAEEFTKALSDPESRAEFGSAAAMTAAEAAAFLQRAASMLAKREPGDERLEYLVRNCGILREYMVKLIDEDVKCRGPLRRALKEGAERTIEAARQPAVAIAQEIIAMMQQALSFADEMADKAGAEEKTWLAAACELAMGAVRCCRHYIVDMSLLSTDETYRFVIHRENEITLNQCAEVYARVLEKTTA